MEPARPRLTPATETRMLTRKKLIEAPFNDSQSQVAEKALRLEYKNSWPKYSWARESITRLEEGKEIWCHYMRVDWCSEECEGFGSRLVEWAQICRFKNTLDCPIIIWVKLTNVTLEVLCVLRRRQISVARHGHEPTTQLEFWPTRTIFKALYTTVTRFKPKYLVVGLQLICIPRF